MRWELLSERSAPCPVLPFEAICMQLKKLVIGANPTAYKQPLQYNWQVFKSLVKQVYQAEKLAPPTHLSQWTSAYSEIFHKAASKQWWSQVLSSGSWAKLAVGVSKLERAGVNASGHS